MKEQDKTAVEPGHCYGNPDFKTDLLNLRIIDEINNASIKTQFIKWLALRRIL